MISYRVSKILIRGIVITTLCTAVVFYGLVQVRWGSNKLSISPSRTATGFDLSAVQEMTGILIITPGGYEQYASIIRSAKGFLYGRLYTFTHKDLKKERTLLAAQGIDMKLVLEDKEYKSFGSDFSILQQYLENHGIGVTTDTHLGTNFVHSKTFVSSDRYIIQSANLTHSTFKTNREHLFIGTQPSIINNLRTIFLKDRDLNDPLSPEDLHPNILVCPINCRVGIETLIRSARKSIIIETQYVQDPVIQDLLLYSQVAEKKIIVAATNSSKLFLKRATPRIARALKKPYVHAKAILIDDRYLLIGSMNISANSLDKNREHGIIVTDSGVIQQFKKQFQQDRLNAEKK